MTNAEMLDTIKLLLGISITDTSQDAVINYYISALQRRINNIINASTFPVALSDLIIDIVIKKIKDDTKDGLDSIDIGDTKMKLNNNTKEITEYLKDHMHEISKFRYTQVI